MVKKICVVSSCIILSLAMAISTFAISRFDAYSYWASAQNEVSFFGNDIMNMFNYSKSTGLNPPASIQSEFYKNGYYSNNIALFNQHSGGTASFDLNSLQPVYSWTYNGIDGTSPLDNGFELVGDAPLTLNDSSATLGSWNGALAKTIYCDTSEQIAVYDFRLSAHGTSDATNFNRVYIGFLFNGSVKSLCFSFNKTQLVFDNRTEFLSNSIGLNPSISFDFSIPRDCRLIIEDDNCSLYIDGVLYKTVKAYSDSSTSDLGVKLAVWKYSYLDIFSYSFKTFETPTTTVIVNLGRSVLIPAGDDMEFYVHLRNGSVTNVTTQITVDLDYSLISQMSLIFNEQLAMVPIEYDNDWLYVKVPAADVDRTFAHCSFTFQTPYVNTTTGDQLRWDMEMAFSDLVFGDPDDIGLNPDIDPEQDKFRIEVIGGINDVKQEIHDGFDIINGTLEDVRQEIQNGFDMVEDALSRDDTFEVETIQPDYDSITAPPDQDVGLIVGPSESEALEDFDAIMLRAESIIADADFVTARYWWQDVFSEIFSWSVLGLLGVLSSFFLIIRALLGR